MTQTETINKDIANISGLLEKHNYEINIKDSSRISISELDKDKWWAILLALLFAVATVFPSIYVILQAENIFLILMCLWVTYNFSPLYAHAIIVRKQFSINTENGNADICYYLKTLKLFSVKMKLENTCFNVKRRTIFFSSSLGGSTSTYQTYFLRSKFLSFPIMTFEVNKNQSLDYKSKIDRVLDYYLKKKVASR